MDQSIISDVRYNRYEFQTGTVNKVSWIPGRVNLSDPLTKPKSSLTESLLLLRSTGHLWCNIKSAAESASSGKKNGVVLISDKVIANVTAI